VKERGEQGRLGQAFASLGEGAPTTEGCPTPEAIWAAVTEDADVESVRQLVEHTSTCPACAEEWRLGRGIDEVSRGETAASATPRRRVFEPSWLAAAASVAIALAAGGYLYQKWSSRDGSGIRSAPTVDIRSLVPAEVLPRERFVLRWSRGPEGARYAVRVVTENAEEIAVVEGLTEPEYLVEQEALRLLEPGAELLWRVQAILPDGRRIQSPTFITAIR